MKNLILDCLGKNVKQSLSQFQKDYMSKLYLHNNKVYQIVRIKRIKKLFSDLVNVTFINYKTKKINSLILNYKYFTERQYMTIN